LPRSSIETTGKESELSAGTEAGTEAAAKWADDDDDDDDDDDST
jgi:hypothetical protein